MDLASSSSTMNIVPRNGEDIAIRVGEPGDEVATRDMPNAQIILIKAVETLERDLGITHSTER
jgi:hypothetical protein